MQHARGVCALESSGYYKSTAAGPWAGRSTCSSWLQSCSRDYWWSSYMYVHIIVILLQVFHSKVTICQDLPRQWRKVRKLGSHTLTHAHSQNLIQQLLGVHVISNLKFDHNQHTFFIHIGSEINQILCLYSDFMSRSSEIYQISCFTSFQWF